ncbi:MAG: F0F1 ATP synthase subunit A [Bacilli bacterium]|nr:F0F1 ATP synthase subunit A [Bacilli bacterium]
MNYLSIQEMGQKFLTTELAGEVFSSLIVIAIEIILFAIIGIMAHFHDPLKKPKGILLLGEIGVNFFDNMVEGLMGPRFKGFGGYVMAIAIYLFLAFIFGLTGLPAPITYLAVPLSLGLSTFVLIHATSTKYTKWRYFKRYIDPVPLFLPINLISMWAPLLSLTLRLFGNAIAGWTLMTMVYYALENLSGMIFKFIQTSGPVEVSKIFLAPIPAAILHLYFDLFSGFIQTTVFISLTMIFVGQEAPEEEEYQLDTLKKGEK